MTHFIKRSKDHLMPTVYILMAICLITTFNCAGISGKRYVENNAFISTYPKMAIQVSPELKYVGEYRGEMFRVSWEWDHLKAKIEQVFHIFLQGGDGDNINKGVVIATFELSEGFHWTSDAIGKSGNYTDLGETEIDGKAWPYFIWRTRNFFGPAKDFVQDQGFSTNQTFLVGAISKVIDHTPGGDALGSIKLAIYYFEDQSQSGFPHITFSDGKPKFIDDFMQRGFNAAQFVRKSDRTPEKAKSKPTNFQRTSKKPSTQTREKRLTYIPKGEKEAKIPTIKLRSTPKPLWESDIEDMIWKHNFYIRNKNDAGYFPNDFVDNGDGTVTDRATGLMWQKAGSPSAMRYWSTQKYVSGLNKQTFAGYNDWRVREPITPRDLIHTMDRCRPHFPAVSLADRVTVRPSLRAWRTVRAMKSALLVTKACRLLCPPCFSSSG